MELSTPAKLGGFGLALVVVFGAATGIGNAVGPVGAAAAASDSSAHDNDHNNDAMAAGGSAAIEAPGGLAVSEGGYTLQLSASALPAGADTPVEFQVTGLDGEPVTDFEVTHDKDLHLIAVRRDSTGFQHVHPTMSPDGTWTTPLELTPGQWRLFADFAPGGADKAVTLGADVAVAGDYDPQPLPPVSRTAEVDGYTVTLNGDLTAGGESELTLSVSKDGRDVTDLQPYLAAYGHLVALRAGDLAYLHVHPAGEPGDGQTEPGPDITFYATAPSAGDYRLYLDFQHDGVVRTAEFTASTSGQPAGDEAGDDAGDDAGTGPSTDTDTSTGEHEDTGDDGHSH